MNLSRFLTRILVPLLLLALAFPVAAAERPIAVWLDGALIAFDVPPTVVEGRTLVPLRAIFEGLGATVSWDAGTQTATATWSEGTLILPVGAPSAQVQGQERHLDVPAQLIGGRTLVPLRFVAEALGAQVGWYGQSRTITINRATLLPATVTRVVDGDTVEVQVNGRKETVRLIGVDTPETVHPTKGVEPYGPEASAFTKERLAGQSVQLELDVEERDQYGRLLAYVYLTNGTLFNAQLMDDGYARLATFPPNVSYVELFTALQKASREGARGLWQAEPAPSTPPSSGVKYDPNGPDRDCGDFNTQAEAQAFYVATGGPARDPHRLDSDRDGIACETLP